MKSFLMVGQSNMAGRGDFGEVPEIKDPRCFMLRNGLWELMREPVNVDAPVFKEEVFGNISSGIGLAPKFAQLYVQTYNEEAGLIPCAHGATRVAQWLPGEILYDHAVFQAKLAMRTSMLAGILWHQGEQDLINEEDVLAHKERTTQVFKGFQKEFGKNIPILVGGLGDFLKAYSPAVSSFVDVINKGLEEICEELENCFFVKADALTCKEDKVHFTSASYREFGERYFHAYQRFVKE